MNESDEIKKIYDSIAEAYHLKRSNPAESSWNDYIEVPAMKKSLQPIVSGKSVLDLGCGTGLLTREIKAWGGDVTGVDVSEKMIALAKADDDSIPYFVSDAVNLPFEKLKFEVVASSLVMHYFSDLAPVFQEVSRVLTDRGEFVFSMHHPVNESFTSSFSKKEKQIPFSPYFHNDKYTWRMCDADIVSYHHTFEDIMKSLREAGYVLKELIECRPEQSSEKVFDDYQFTSRFPTFCLFHAGKV